MGLKMHMGDIRGIIKVTRLASLAVFCACGSLAAQEADLIPPGDIGDLVAVAGGNPGEVLLSWSSPGDDLGAAALSGSNGALYLVQYSTFEGAAWDIAAAQIVSACGEETPGSARQLSVTGLLPNTNYRFVVWAKDGSGNAGAVSNTASSLTVIEKATTVYFDEIATNSIVASAYAPAPAFTGLGSGQSGTNVAIDKNGWTWAGWHGAGWSVKSPMPTPRWRLGVAALQGKVYAVGGMLGSSSLLNANEAYDPATDSWTVRSGLARAARGLAVTSAAGKVYAIGGYPVYSVNAAYDPLTDTWANAQNRYYLSSYHAAAASGGKVYSLGGQFTSSICILWLGCNYTANNLNYNGRYDPVTNTWVGRANMPVSRYMFAAAAAAGRIYAFGGSGTARVDMYDPDADTWSQRSDMPAAYPEPAAAAVGKKVYVFSGSDNMEYDTLLDTWTKREDVPTARTSAGAAAVGGRIYLIGGNGAAGTLQSNEAYDPGTAAEFPGLTPNTRYTFKAKARDQAGRETAESSQFSVYTLAAVALPQNGEPVFSNVSTSAISVSWSSGTAYGGFNGPGAVYTLEVSTYPDFSASVGYYTSGETKVALSGLASGEDYYFRIKALNPDGLSGDYLVLGTTSTGRVPARISSAPFSGLGLHELTANWETTFSSGTVYYLRLSTASTSSSWMFSAATTAVAYRFSGLAANTRYYGYVSTASDSGYLQSGAGTTSVEPPLSVYFDEISATKIVASAYATAPAFSNLHMGLSGTNVAINTNTWTWAGWHGEKWTSKKPLSKFREGGAAAAVDGKLYLIGGWSSLLEGRNEAYDPVTDSWMDRAPIPGARMFATAAEVNGKIYVVGGHTGVNPITNNFEYDPASDSWAPREQAISGLNEPFSASMGEKVYVLGDYWTSMLQEYSTEGNKWVLKMEAPGPRSKASGGVIGGKMYVVGGGAPAEDTNEVYEPLTDSWSGKAPMPTPRANLSAGVIGGKLYAVGGLDGYGGIYGSNEAYDPVSNSWDIKVPMPTPRFYMGAAVIDGRLYTVGGFDGFVTNENEEYDPGVAGVFRDLTPNTMYSFKAKARNQDGSETEESVTFSTCTLAVAPSNVVATAISSSSVNISWEAEGNPEGTEFEVGYSTSTGASWDNLFVGPYNAVEVSSLEPYTTYYFKVRAVNMLGVPTKFVSAAPVRTLLPAPVPVPLHAVAVWSSSITWTWAAGGYAERYRVVSSSGGDISGDLAAGVTAWTETGLLANTLYERKLVSFNTSGSGTSVPAARFTLAAVPGAPVADGRTMSGIDLSWQVNGNPEIGTGYQVWGDISPDFFQPSVILVAVSSHSVTGLAADTSYYFKVRAINGSGEFSGFGPIATYSTLPLPPSPPSAPYGHALGISSIAWNWSALGSAYGYKVYSASEHPVLLGSPVLPGYLQDELVPNTAYRILVAGVNISGEGLPALSTSAFTLAAPPVGVSAGVVHVTSATVNWALGVNPAGTMAEVYRSTDNYSFANVFAGPELTFSDTGLGACTTYYFKVRNLNGENIATAYAGPLSVFTGAFTPLAPDALGAVSLGGNKIAISWTPSPSPDIAKYNLYYDAGTGSPDYSVPLSVLPASATSYVTGVLVSSPAYIFALRAVNRCGVEEKNTSLLASAASVASITGVQAAIKDPHSGKRINGNRVTVIAEIVHGEEFQVSSVLFQYRPRGGVTWSSINAANRNHPNPDLNAPYFVHWDVTVLPDGDYDLRAVAEDTSGNADPSAPFVTVAVGRTDADITETLLADGDIKKEQAINNAVNSVVQSAAAEQPWITKVTVPSGAVTIATVTLSIVNNPRGAPVQTAELNPIGQAAQIELSNGQHLFANDRSAEIVMTYRDEDGDGVVDGTAIKAELLRIYSYDAAAGAWKGDLECRLDREKRQVIGATRHFSYFAIFAPMAAGINGARAYPNPWKPGRGGTFDAAGVTFDGLPASALIQIFTIAGELVRELQVTAADAGVKVWDGRNTSGAKAASGVYIVLVRADGKKKALKLGVER